MVSAWLRSPKLRRGVAVASLVLATGGLVLVRGSSSAAPLTGVSVSLSGGKNAASFTGPRAKGRLALSHAAVQAGELTRVYAEIDLAATAGERDVERAPLSMVVVLDTSGSMSGEKITDAKRSVTRLIREMRDGDELAIVEYSDHARVVEPLSRVGDARGRLISAVEGLSSGGGTNIPSGLEAALGELRSAAPGRVRRVVLASDGLDGSRAEAEALARRSFGDGTTISSLGIGLDFDESYMSSLAVAGHGNFAFIDAHSSLATFLSRELREASTTTLEHATFTLRLPSGVHFVSAHGADARVVDGAVELSLGSLFAGDERRVVVELDAELEAGDARGLRAEARWGLAHCDRGACDARVSISELALRGTADAAEVSRTRDNAIFASAVSVTASKKQIEAAEAWSKGDTTTARRLADGNVAALKSAMAAAPAPEAAALESQIKSYEAARGQIGKSPASPAARAATKTMMQKDVANFGRKAVF